MVLSDELCVLSVILQVELVAISSAVRNVFINLGDLPCRLSVAVFVEPMLHWAEMCTCFFSGDLFNVDLL